MNFVRWFGRLTIWLFFIIRDSVDGFDSSACTARQAIPVFWGAIFLLVAFAVPVAEAISNDTLRHPYLIAAGCFAGYLIMGVVLFFSERNTNIPIPWYENGSW